MMDRLEGKQPQQEIVLPILNVTKDNIDGLLPTIKQTVFANELK
jgi:ribose transport system substrate-binding protein